ncbi:MAG: indoleamine 2,3-dioxygenase [Deltaproteobacteria bacterium]|nr:indoleamine 2,3-dioxygenase [Deltaproteobacteria bacterium]
MEFKRGFLPNEDPPSKLPEDYSDLERFSSQLNKLIINNRLREEVTNFSFPDFEKENDRMILERILTIMTFLTHAYVWQNEPSPVLPKQIAKPLVQVANKLCRKPVLTYASYALFNWERLDKNADISLNNVRILQNFLGGQDEDWFIMIHVVIEYQAGPAISALEAWLNNNAQATYLQDILRTVYSCLCSMNATLKRMPEKCDPYIYYRRVRPYLFGWKNNPSLKDGLIYEGVWNEPQFFRGETGAQSTIIPCLDAFFGIEHEDDPLKTYLLEMRDYMPVEHKNFLEKLEKKGSIRGLVISSNDKNIQELYNACIKEIEEFRTTHLNFASEYIFNQNQTYSNPTKIGTGGTPFMDYLKKHRDETLKALIT